MSEMTKSPEVVSQHDNEKLAMWFFLGGEVVFFATLILTFALVRLQNAADFAQFRTQLSIPLIGANTFVLIASSYMVVRSIEAVRAGNQKGLRYNLIGVLAFGLLFLGGQAFEWSELFRAGMSLKDTFGTPFFAVTGVHGTHVFVGLLWGIYVLVSASRGAFSRQNYRGVENFGLYWHFVDIVWIVLFTLIYLI
jgi:heme/copper-type cytochrome/quinol oxidase subunit 3